MAGPELSEAEEDRSPFRRAGWVAAGGFLAFVAAGAAAVVATSGGGHPPSSTHVVAPSAPSTAVASALPSTAGCHPTDTSQQIPQSPPAATWTVFKTIAVPTSPVAGPMVFNGQMASCFAHTPAGALIATWQIYVRSVFADQWRQVTEAQIMPGPGRDAFIANRSMFTGDTSDPGAYGQVAGFTFAAYSPTTAVVQLITRFSDGSMQVGTATVVWSSGDWRLQLQPDGAAAASVQPVESLEGFIAWGGV